MLYHLKLILNYNHGVALFRQKQILKSASYKHLQNGAITIYSITQCLATFYLEQFSSPSSVKEILDQIHISKWTVQTDSLFSIADYPGHISDKFTILY